MVLAPCTGVFGLIGFSGRKGRERDLLDLMESLAPHYGDDAWFLGQLAFSRVEAGDTAGAREPIARAVELDPQSGHNAHVCAHACYEAGEREAGLAELQQWLPRYAREGLLHCHLNRHVALWQLELGDCERALQTYVSGVHPGGSWGPPINALSDSASFLWRLDLAGQLASVIVGCKCARRHAELSEGGPRVRRRAPRACLLRERRFGGTRAYRALSWRRRLFTPNRAIYARRDLKPL